ncbi:PEGA domain-containing protein [Prolixibacteraceae bacterium Z1-6]|uniref:PEGA domain-containing protein n=1 Tax=Draconibacterium aestuarii TaxID=2998507 RepID=A0A9X3FAZ6_9BACT|nr:PEGA domain-containing protein [Prolixibacteraceae bacterium Z1-6]
MNKISLTTRLVIVVFGLLVLSGCGTILSGRSNTLVFTTESSPDAEVYLDGEKIGEAPGRIKVETKKIQHGSMLTLSAEGYEEKDYLILRKQNAAYTVVDLLVGGVPVIVDYATGNIYQPKPRKFKYELQKK